MRQTASCVLPIVLLLLWCFHAGGAAAAKDAGQFRLTVLHFNDFHARFEQTSVRSGGCKDYDVKAGNCFGGLARMYQAVQDIKAKDETHTLLLNAGDMYQGTVWYTLFKSKAMIPFMNMFNLTACALGNHEFDDSPEGLLPLAQNATFPIVCSNCDFTEMPEFHDLVKPYIVIEVEGRKIGIIGYLTPHTRELAKTGKMLLRDEIVQMTKYSNLLKSEGVNIIIGLGHSGYTKDKEIAAKVPHLDLVVGAHSHSFLYDKSESLPSIEQPRGPYPTIVTQKSGRRVPVVQAYAFTKYLGKISLDIDKDGEVQNIDGRPVLLDSKYKQNEDVLNEISKWKSELFDLEREVVGETKVVLDGLPRYKESTLGDFVADGVLAWYEEETSILKSGPGQSRWPKYTVVLINSGSLRSSYEAGNITMSDLLTAHPFENTFVNFIVQMKVLRQALQYSASSLTLDGRSGTGSFLQVAGMKYTIDLARRDNNDRVSKIGLRHSEEPGYVTPDDTTPVRILTTDYVAEGNDGFDMFEDDSIEVNPGPLDVDVIKWYLNKTSPVNQRTDGRISVINASTSNRSLVTSRAHSASTAAASCAVNNAWGSIMILAVACKVAIVI